MINKPGGHRLAKMQYDSTFDAEELRNTAKFYCQIQTADIDIHNLPVLLTSTITLTFRVQHFIKFHR